MRLQRYLARSGVASRRRAERMISSGRVRVNGDVVTELGTRVDADRDTVQVDGRTVRPAEPIWIALHKPRGVLVSRGDTHGRRTVYALLPRRHRALFHVGRLDRDSEGLILLTNEGETAHRLLHPRHGVHRVYEVEVRGEPSDGTLRRLRVGVQLEDGRARALSAVRVRRRPGRRGRPGADRPNARDRTSPAPQAHDAGVRRGDSEAEPRRGKSDGPQSASTWIRLTLAEGRKREVRRLMDAVGHPVERLVRIQYGPIELGALPPGRWRRLDAAEVATLRSTGKPEHG